MLLGQIAEQLYYLAAFGLVTRPFNGAFGLITLLINGAIGPVTRRVFVFIGFAGFVTRFGLTLDNFQQQKLFLRNFGRREGINCSPLEP